MATQKLDLKKTLKALDKRDLNFYNNLTDEEKKAFSPYLIMRYGATVQSSNPDELHLHILGVNEMVNMNFGVLTKHKGLFWKLLAMCGSGKIQFHPWINYKKKNTDNKVLKFLEERFPHMKRQDIDLMAEMNDKNTCQQWAEELGMSKKEIKEILG